MAQQLFKTLLLAGEIARMDQEEGGDHKIVYLDSKDRETAGVGHLLLPQELEVYSVGDEVPDDVRGDWFLADLYTACDDAKAFLDKDTYRLPVEVRCIVAHMAFQLGRPSLFGFENTQAALKRRDFDWAADEMLDSKWFREDTPERCQRLSDRMRKLA